MEQSRRFVALQAMLFKAKPEAWGVVILMEMMDSRLSQTFMRKTVDHSKPLMNLKTQYR